MVARAGRDHAALSLLGRELEDLVEGAAQLEGPGALEHLSLHEEAEPEPAAQGMGVEERRAPHRGSNALARGDDIFKGNGHRIHGPRTSSMGSGIVVAVYGIPGAVAPPDGAPRADRSVRLARIRLAPVE